MISVEAVVAHRDAVVALDTIDTIRGLAGLQLVPANAARLLRLEGGIQSLASLTPAARADRRMTRAELQRWLDESPFQVPEDPFNNSFVEELTFFGGSYRVHPGTVEGSAFLFRRLAAAIFRSGEWNARDPFRREAAALALATLRLSDAVARRADVERGARPGLGALLVPPERALSALKNAVLFSDDELEELLDGLPRDVLEPLTQEMGLPLTTNREHLGTGPFYARPLLDVGGALIVALPHAVLGALLHALVSLAIRHGVIERLASTFRLAVFYSVIESLDYIGSPRLYPPLSAPPEGFVDAVLSLDNDKVVYLLLVTDPLDDYDGDVIYGEWRDDGLRERIEARLLAAEADLLFSPTPPNAILHLIVLQSIGRGAVVGFGDRPEPVRSHRLVMSAAELDVICLLDGGRQLTLWQYARAADRLRDEARVLSFSELDEFDVYRKNRSYYLSDNGRPNMISMAVGGGANMLADVADRFDFHGASADDGRSVIEVALLHGERRVPIYIPYPPGLGRPRVLVEGIAVPMWVVAPEREFDPRYRVRFAQFADLISYWLWQITPDVAPLVESIAESEDKLVFELELIEDEAWFNDTPAEDDEPLTWEVVASDRVKMTFHPAVMDSLSGPTNAGERDIVADLVRAIAAVDGSAVDDGFVTAVVDRHAPLGQKKKLVTFRQTNDPRLDDTDLPPFRRVQEADESELLDEAGFYLVDQSGRQPGPLEGREAQRSVLNEVVDFHFRQLESLVATLQPEGLLEWLVVFHEAIVAHQAFRDLQVPSELACFSTAPRMTERVAKEIPETAQAAISSRFLIEYVTARPPSGLRPMSLAVYDRLLALASEIFNKGSLSDIVHHELAQPGMSILSSKRLGVDPETVHQPGRERYLGVQAGVELERRMSDFGRVWEPRPERSEPPEELRELDDAVEIELGIRLTDLISFHMEVINAGFRRDGEPKVAAFEELRAELIAELGWPEARVDTALELSTLTPRDDFWRPSRPFLTRDVYPWRFDRRLSYSRRPLILRRNAGADEVLWGTRHLFAASRYFFGLATNGRLKADSVELKRVMTSRRSAEAREFNDRVAQLLDEHRDSLVKTRVTKFGRTRIEKARGQLISDIDVLVADRRRRQLLLIETKDLAVARTPAELAHELRELYRGENGGTAAVDRLLEVAAWVQGRRQQVLGSLGLPTKDAKRWRVRPLVVVDQELLTPYLYEVAVPTLSYRSLADRLATGQLP